MGVQPVACEPRDDGAGAGGSGHRRLLPDARRECGDGPRDPAGRRPAGGGRRGARPRFVARAVRVRSAHHRADGADWRAFLRGCRCGAELLRGSRVGVRPVGHARVGAARHRAAVPARCQVVRGAGASGHGPDARTRAASADGRRTFASRRPHRERRRGAVAVRGRPRCVVSQYDSVPRHPDNSAPLVVGPNGRGRRDGGDRTLASLRHRGGGAGAARPGGRVHEPGEPRPRARHDAAAGVCRAPRAGRAAVGGSCANRPRRACSLRWPAAWLRTP